MIVTPKNIFARLHYQPSRGLIIQHSREQSGFRIGKAGALSRLHRAIRATLAEAQEAIVPGRRPRPGGEDFDVSPTDDGGIAVEYAVNFPHRLALDYASHRLDENGKFRHVLTLDHARGKKAASEGFHVTLGLSYVVDADAPEQAHFEAAWNGVSLPLYALSSPELHDPVEAVIRGMVLTVKDWRNIRSYSSGLNLDTNQPQLTVPGIARIVKDGMSVRSIRKPVGESPEALPRAIGSGRQFAAAWLGTNLRGALVGLRVAVRKTGGMNASLEIDQLMNNPDLIKGWPLPILRDLQNAAVPEPG